MVHLNLECDLTSAHMDARSGVIAGDLQLEKTRFEGKSNIEPFNIVYILYFPY